MADPGVGVALVAGIGLYIAGARRLARPLPQREAVAFAGAMTVLAVAVLPPLDSLAGQHLAAHMAQHVLLLAVAAPLLALANPLPTALEALPSRWRGPALSWWTRVEGSRRRRWATWSTATLVLSSVVMVAWHLPSLYEAALRNQPVHALEHATFLLTSAAFWWAIGLGAGQEGPPGAAVAFVFAGAMPGSALGAAMTFATTTWYPQYPSLADQQLAGVVMWAFAGLAYVIAAAAVFALWLAASDRKAAPRPLMPQPVP